MRQWLALAAIVILLMGCAASPEEQAAYHKSISDTNLAMMASVQEQTKAIRVLEVSTMKHYSDAMVSASKTTDPTDNVILAFAWGAWTATKRVATVPDLVYPSPPVSDVDRIRAWTPIVGMAVPLLSPLLHGWADLGGGDTYQVSDQGEVHIGSYNPGSYNSAGGNQTTAGLVDSTMAPQSAEEDAEATPLDGEDPEYTSCMSNPPGGYSGSGTPMYSSSLSCETHYGSL